MIELLDNIEHSPFIHGRSTYFLVGFVLLFVLAWAVGYTTGKWERKGGFWADQKDNMIIVILFGMSIIVWDTQILAAFEIIVGDMKNFNVHVEQLEHNSHYYFLLAPAIDRFYELYILLKTKKPENEKN